MIKIAQAVQTCIEQDDIAFEALRRGWLNISAYARTIRPSIEAVLLKPVQPGSIITALARYQAHQGKSLGQPVALSGLSLHPSLWVATYERTEATVAKVSQANAQALKGHSFFTATYGVSEVTVIADKALAVYFHHSLSHAKKVYEKDRLVGITARFHAGDLEQPDLIFSAVRTLTYKGVAII